jgi:hypothetical protein
LFHQKITSTWGVMTDDTPIQASPIEGAKHLVRILARRRRATAEQDLRAIFEKEAAGTAEFKPAIEHALLHDWISRRSDGFLVGPRREGRKAAGLA